MPQGNAMDEELVFTDRMYDGVNNNGILKYGLGQLTDGKVADNYYDHMDPYFGKGYHWVGWDRQATPQLEITFRFDSVRNFTSMMLHCNNQFDQGVSLFASVVIWFSVKGGYYSTNSLRFTPQRDDTHPDAKHLNIELNHNIGETVKCQFEYYSRWIMFSEVSFESSFMTENYTVPSSTSVPYDVDPMFVPVKPTTHPSTGRQNEIIALSSTTGSAEKPEKIVKPAAKAKTGLIGGLVCLVIIIAILIGVILILLWRQKQNKSLMKGPRIVEQVHCDLNSVRITNNQLGTQHSRRSNPTYDQLLLQDDPEGDVPWVSKRSLPEIPPTCVENSGCSSRIYAEPDITKSTGHSSKSNFLQQPYAETDVIHKFNIQGVSGNNIYSVPSASLEKLTNLNPVAPEINMEDLEFLEVLGDGQFGQVHLCEIENHELLNGNGANKQTNILVAVKMLRKDANKNARSDFMTEIKIMSQLHHDNIVRLLGKCTKEEPWCMIVEYMPNGDLNQFLFDRDLDTQINGAAKSQPISFEDLIYIVKQITDGMQYLSSLNFVHRDLATRNCLVGQRYRIRIADFGMSRSLYSADYYKIEGKAILPIRWMAWESILYGKFSTNSDVWAYGVTLWEIFTLAKEQPYSDLTDQQVIENTGEYYRNTGEEVILDRPSACPKDIYCYMKQCWRRDTETRPTFDYLDGIFQQKNDGYEPEFED
ncbi:discoidin domain-containing receptor 2-like [Saccoglossus kowalevskii]|uniref:Discoidin domain-containing receptor 2-like n=1 Tax=Saccoglossus kowalevskii TaxID=10224 RepID=A0ABM0GT16_SACKO|nr:PREDICTED: discoidin domain-containing receptor 2-like [Saccoglossus kowalevskii]